MEILHESKTQKRLMINLNKIITTPLIFFILVFHRIDSYSQNSTKLDSIQGIWYIIYPGYPESTENNYIIYKDIKSLVIYSDEKDTTHFSVEEGYQGFLDFDKDARKGEDKEIDINLLRSNGKYFAFVSAFNLKDNKIMLSDCVFPSYFTMEDGRIEMGSSGTAIYSRVNDLPNLLIMQLYNRDKQKNRNYIKEYLDIKVSEIKASKSILYSEDKKPTKIVLKQGEVVIIKEEKEDWIKIAGSVQMAKTKEELARDEKNKDFESQEVAKFIDEDFEGWVKKSDVK